MCGAGRAKLDRAGGRGISARDYARATDGGDAARGCDNVTGTRCSHPGGHCPDRDADRDGPVH